MAGLLGGGLTGLLGKVDPSQYTVQDKLNILAGILQDSGPQGGNAAATARGQVASRQQQAQLNGLLNGYFSGSQPTPDAEGAAPGLNDALGALGIGATAPPATAAANTAATQTQRLQKIALLNPELAKTLNTLANQDVAQGTDGTLYSKQDGHVVGRLGNHQVVNGFNVDLGASDAPSFIPQLPSGTAPDGKGGVVNIPGLPAAMGAQTRATEDAKNASQASYAQVTAQGQAAGKAVGELPYEGRLAQARAAGQGAGSSPYDLVTRPVMDANGKPTGEVEQVSRATALGLDGLPPLPGRGGLPGGRGGARTQSPADAAYANKTAEAAAGRFQGYVDAGVAAQKNLDTTHRIDQLLGDFEGGKYSPTGVDIASAANGFGIKLDPKLGNKQAAQALSQQLAAGLHSQLPGPLSDRDVQFLQSMTPNLSQSKDGRRAIIETQTKLAQRSQAVAAAAQVWQNKYGGINKTDANGRSFEDTMRVLAAQNPLFGRR